MMMRVTAGKVAVVVGMTLAQVFLCQAGIRSAAAPMRTYTDKAGGISLQYPAVWTFSKTAAAYFPLIIAPGGEPLQAVFSFSPKGNFYEHTTLTGLQFLYRRQGAATRSECESILSTNREGAQALEHLTIRGAPFAHLSTGEAGMMKSVSQEGYATWRGGTCYLFEADLGQIAEGTDDDKTRNLTAAEVRALRRHLDEVLQSVLFSAPHTVN